MRKGIIVLLQFVFILLLFTCKKNPGAQVFYLNTNILGVRQGGAVKFYETKEGHPWRYLPKRDFACDKDCADVFYQGGNFVGVSDGKLVKFYKTDLKGTWKYNTNTDFTSPENFEGISSFDGGGSLGVWKGNTIRFYQTSPQGTWTKSTT